MNHVKLEGVAKLALLTMALGASQQSLAGEWSAAIFAGQTKADGLSDECLATFPPPAPNAPRPIEGGGVDCSGDDTSSGVGINIAYNFNDTFGIEAGLVDLGEFDIGTVSFSAGGPLTFEDLSVEAKVGYLAGTASYNLTDRWSLTGRLGVYDADATLKSRFLTVDLEVDADVYVGASLDYEFTSNWSAQVRYDNFDIDMASIGLKYSFR